MNTIIKLEIWVELDNVTQECMHNVGQMVLLDSLDVELPQISLCKTTVSVIHKKQ